MTRALILPHVGLPVRVIDGAGDPLADVVSALPEQIELALHAPAAGGTVELLYSTPRGVISLTGTLTAGEPAVFAPDGQRRAEQRRCAYRVPVSVTGRLRTAEGEHPVTILDLSAVGARLKDGPVVEHGDQMTLRFAVPAGEIVAPATVVRVEHDDVFAVSFGELPRSADTALDHFLAVEQRKRL